MPKVEPARGRKPKDDPSLIKSIILKNRNRIVQDGKLIHPSNEIWQLLKDEFSINKSPKALYTFVSCNSWNIKEELFDKTTSPDTSTKENSGQEVLFTQEDIVSGSATSESIEESEGETNFHTFVDEQSLDASQQPQPSTTFKIHIPKDKWKVIEPEEKTYFRKISKEVNRKQSARKYKVLKPGIWTDVFTDLVWNSIKWPCTWSFKRNYISIRDDAKFWLLIKGACGCGNHFKITVPNPPPADPLIHGLNAQVLVWGRKENHSQESSLAVRKRPYAGLKRKILGEDMIEKKVKPGRMRNEMASDLIDFDEKCYPAHLPSKDVARQIRAEALKSKRLQEDPLKSLQLLKYSTNPVYRFCIHDIGLDPFYVHIWTPNQIKIYNLYCSQSYSRLIIDATGKIVHKLPKPNATYSGSGHVFLYLGVIQISGPGEGVTQMLSERHNSNAIAYWLSEWCRAGATIPSEIIVDDSAAFISAASKVFGKEASTASYINNCFLYLRDELTVKPKCLIRIDISHLTNLIRKWPEISKLTQKRTKEFFIRAVILVAKEKYLENLKYLLNCIFVVALSEFEGNSISTGEITPCESMKTYLLGKISGANINQTQDEPQTEGEPSTSDSVPVIIEEDLQPATLKSWIETIERESKDQIVDDGDRDNIMYNPPIVKKLKLLLYALPLWNAALPFKMSSPYPKAVGAYVESQIGNLKNNLISERLRVDSFVQEYLKICDGTINLASTLTIKPPNREPKISKKSASGFDEHFNPNQLSLVDQEVCNSNLKKDNGNPLEERMDRPNTKCPACRNGDLPGGAHRCQICDVAVHALDTCSVSASGDSEGFGEMRICLKCLHVATSAETNKEDPVGSPIDNFAKTSKTSIMERADLSTADVGIQSPKGEPTSVEGWRGLSLPPKKRMPGYYWRSNPDFLVMLNYSSKSNKLGVLKNGMNPSLKFNKVNKTRICLSNTCSFDAPCQLFATAYCDSFVYREEIDRFPYQETILDVAKTIATQGISQGAYNKRALALMKCVDPEPLKGGAFRINSAIVSSALLRKMMIPATVSEVYSCSSQHCPNLQTTREVRILSVELKSIINLEAELKKSDVNDCCPCHLPMSMAEVMKIDAKNYIDDPALSSK